MISILIPTYMRSKNVADFCAAANNTSVFPDKVEILFGNHLDDLHTACIIEQISKKHKIIIKRIILEKYPDGKPHLSYFWNELYKHASFPILGFFGDDVHIRTKGWDRLVISEFKRDKHILLYGDDVHCAKGTAATLFFTHRECHEKFGFYMYPDFRRCWMDQFWEFVYKRAGKLRYRKDLILEHLHPGKFKRRWDKTFRALERLTPLEPSFSEAEPEIERCAKILEEMSMA